MIRTVLIGLWICIVALGSLFFAVQRNIANASADGQAQQATNLDHGKTGLFSVPIIVNGEVSGYVVSSLVYTLDSGAAGRIKAPASYFINDEIFRQFYGSYSDTKQVENVSFERVKKAVIDGVNARFPEPLVEDILVEQFDYITVRDIRNQNMRGLEQK
ncbi:MAG: hypothetical protein ACRECW_09080 [Phyllobacterium sp.]